MARTKVASGGAAVADEAPTAGEQGNMFPDLDKSKPAEAALLAASKKWLKIRDERKDYLTDAKEKEDEAHTKMVELADAVNISTFSVGERQINIEETKKAKVKQKKDKDGDNEEDSDDSKD